MDSESNSSCDLHAPNIGPQFFKRQSAVRGLDEFAGQFHGGFAVAAFQLRQVARLGARAPREFVSLIWSQRVQVILDVHARAVIAER